MTQARLRLLLATMMYLKVFNLGENLLLPPLRDVIWAYTSLKSNTRSYWTACEILEHFGWQWDFHSTMEPSG